MSWGMLVKSGTYPWRKGPDMVVEDVLHTPDEWCEILSAEIADPDGWRSPNYKDWDEPITKDEFDERLLKCTINMRKYPKFISIKTKEVTDG